jgi:hypothetical protein
MSIFVIWQSHEIGLKVIFCIGRISSIRRRWWSSPVHKKREGSPPTHFTTIFGHSWRKRTVNYRFMSHSLILPKVKPEVTTTFEQRPSVCNDHYSAFHFPHLECNLTSEERPPVNNGHNFGRSLHSCWTVFTF